MITSDGNDASRITNVSIAAVVSAAPEPYGRYRATHRAVTAVLPLAEHDALEAFARRKGLAKSQAARLILMQFLACNDAASAPSPHGG